MNRRGFIAALAGAFTARFFPKPEPLSLSLGDFQAKVLAPVVSKLAADIDRQVMGLGYFRIVQAHPTDPNMARVTEFWRKDVAPFVVMPAGFRYDR